MTFDTFDTYNTDEAYNDKGTTAKGLVAAYKKDNPEGSKDDFYSKLNATWKEDKNGYVKAAVDEAFKETPKAEENKEAVIETPKKEEVAEKVIEQTAPKTEEKKQTLDKQTENFMGKNNAISYTQEDTENKRQEESLERRWNTRLANADKMYNAIKKVDDHMVEQLPTFMIKRYLNGEFGDISDTSTPEGRESKKAAQLRLAHFMINGVQTALRRFSNGAAIAAGRTPLYANEMSDYEQYQLKNFTEGMENRWNKYKQDTQAAIDLAKEGGMSEEKITDSIATISSNNRLQSAFNQMNERQKVFALNVLAEIGNRMGNMNDAEFANTLMGMSAMGDSLDYKEAAAMLVYRTVKDPEKRNAILSSLGFDGSSLGGSGILGGLGNALTGGGKDKEDNPETTLEDGTNVDAGKVMSNADYEKITKAAEELGNKYYNGEIDEEKFRSEYAKLEAEMKKHGVYNKFKNIMSQDDYIKQIAKNKRIELSGKLDELNNDAKNLSKDDYLKKYEDLKAQAEKWGASAKELKSMENDKNKYVKKTKK